MILSPFPLLHPYRDRLTVAWWGKTDDVTCQRAAAMVGTTAYALARQMHEGTAAAVSEPVDGTLEADALVTATTRLLLFAKSADCQSFVLYCPRRHALAVVHAGWRGLERGILQSAVALLRREHGVAATDLLVGAAPSLGLCCAEFTDPATEMPGTDPVFFNQRFVDLQGIADAQLIDCGIRPEHIDRMRLCTMCNAPLLWSARAAKDSIDKGHRNLLGAMLQ